MDTRQLTNVRATIYNTVALYRRTHQTAELQWRVGNNQRFEIYYTDAKGWTALHVISHRDVMTAPDASWLTSELFNDGIEMSRTQAERIVQQYALATTALWHPNLPRYVQSLENAAA